MPTVVLGLDDTKVEKEGMMELKELPVHQTSAPPTSSCANLLGANLNKTAQSTARHCCHLLSSHHTPLNPNTLLVAMRFLSENVLLVKFKRSFLFSQPP